MTLWIPVILSFDELSRFGINYDWLSKLLSSQNLRVRGMKNYPVMNP